MKQYCSRAHCAPNNQKEAGIGTWRTLCAATKGISLIALIITIIVIIILAAIVIFTGLNTPDRANFAKFTQEFSDFRLALTQDFMNKKAEYTIAGKSRSDAQIYYIIANGGNPDLITNINEEPSDDTTSGQYAEVTSLEDLGVAGLGIKGTYAFLISDDRNVKEWNKNTKYYEPNETHYVTDEGDVFILKGYRVEQNGSEKWFLNEKVSSDREIKGEIAIQPGNYTITTDSNGDSPAGTNLNKTTVAKLYIQMSPTVEGGSVTIKEKETGNTVTMPYEVTKNGTYQFTLTTTVEGVSGKDITVEVNNWAVPTVASVGIEVGDYVTYAGDGSYTLKQSETGINDSEATSDGYTDGEKPIEANTNAKWRVWKVEKDGDNNITSIVIMPTAPVNKFRLRGAAGFTNSVDIIEAVCDMYKNDSLGVTTNDVWSLKIEDLEDTRVSSNLISARDSYSNSYSSTGKYGGTKSYTERYLLYRGRRSND